MSHPHHSVTLNKTNHHLTTPSNRNTISTAPHHLYITTKPPQNTTTPSTPSPLYHTISTTPHQTIILPPNPHNTPLQHQNITTLSNNPHHSISPPQHTTTPSNNPQILQCKLLSRVIHPTSSTTFYRLKPTTWIIHKSRWTIFQACTPLS